MCKQGNNLVCYYKQAYYKSDQFTNQADQQRHQKTAVQQSTCEVNFRYYLPNFSPQVTRNWTRSCNTFQRCKVTSIYQCSLQVSRPIWWIIWSKQITKSSVPVITQKHDILTLLLLAQIMINVPSQNTAKMSCQRWKLLWQELSIIKLRWAIVWPQEI